MVTIPADLRCFGVEIELHAEVDEDRGVLSEIGYEIGFLDEFGSSKNCTAKVLESSAGNEVSDSVINCNSKNRKR